MTKKYEVGTIIKGKVTAIKPFGAFVALDEETQGLVHISQVAHGFVKDINDLLNVGDEVDVKIIGIDEAAGRISLSIRETQPAPEKPAASAKPRKQKRDSKPQQFVQQQKVEEGYNLLEDQLKKWLDNNK